MPCPPAPRINAARSARDHGESFCGPCSGAPLARVPMTSRVPSSPVQPLFSAPPSRDGVLEQEGASHSSSLVWTIRETGGLSLMTGTDSYRCCQRSRLAPGGSARITVGRFTQRWVSFPSPRPQRRSGRACERRACRGGTQWPRLVRCGLVRLDSSNAWGPRNPHGRCLP